MSMTREEVNKRLKGLRMRCQRLLVSSRRNPEEWRKDIAALDLALSALRPVSREQVEKVWRASWNPVFEDWRNQIEGDKCSACGFEHYGSQFNFCPNCGAPMTDEAVDILLGRLEALKDG